MAYQKRIYYTPEQKAEMWDRWQRGETLHQIARLFDRYHTSVRDILARTGGIRHPLRLSSTAFQSMLLICPEYQAISTGYLH